MAGLQGQVEYRREWPTVLKIDDSSDHMRTIHESIHVDFQSKSFSGHGSCTIFNLLATMHPPVSTVARATRVSYAPADKISGRETVYKVKSGDPRNQNSLLDIRPPTAFMASDGEE